MSGLGLAEAIHAAARRWESMNCPTGLGGCDSQLVRVFGGIAGVIYRTDEVEIARRRAQNCEPFTDVDVLDGLMGLPIGAPVAMADLTEQERIRLRRAPLGAIDWIGDHVVRRAVAPLSVRLALVTAKDWQAGLRRAGRFTPYCARAVLLPAAQAEDVDLGLRASFFGIGVGVVTERRFQMLIQPRPYVRKRHTPEQWWFAEQIYRQISVSANAGEPSE